MRLTVKPLKNRDTGSGMAVIDRDALGDRSPAVTSSASTAVAGRFRVSGA